jgi:DNA-binding response OmpR family regulator
MITIDKTKRTILVDGKQVELTNQQWDILECFAEGEVMSVGRIAQRVYGTQSESHKSVASVTVSRLKRMVGKDDFIIKARGAGNYVLHECVQVIEKELVTE